MECSVRVGHTKVEGERENKKVKGVMQREKEKKKEKKGYLPNPS